ncbi:hypothetical protein [Candidatus Magnetobacterium casense]|uniref:Uncharacterized protein n=1 Tax=Candidatus Magnetobacterium casense TaxID=1455061 RepID=A0ABS6S1V3_9BACT|nr:hypothetical protein [Candidatus Magnetobacterium casensis]MBV6342825.1 hypothetical protein [Candidatus Magnetobacterium casensis]
MHLGNFILISNVDFLVGMNVNATAVNLATAISRLPDFAATVVGPVVSVTYGPTMDEVEFWALHLGTRYNLECNPVDSFITSSPSIGGFSFMNFGSPSIGAPALTV